MARTILITIKDNEAAELFVRVIDQLQRREYPKLTDEGIREAGMILLEPGVTLDAVIARPTVWCKCTGTQKKRGRIKPVGDYTQKPHFGWWVHALCNRPEREVVRNFIKHRILGYNDLLGEILAKPEEVNDGAARDQP